jgi:hypothetical protein
MKSLIKVKSFAICILLLTCIFCDLKAQDAGFTEKDFAKYEKECSADSIPVFSYRIGCYDNITGARADSSSYSKVYKDYDLKIYKFKDFPGYELRKDSKMKVAKEPTYEGFKRWIRKKYGL